ncbi:hypothetical protein ES703_82510 [subsurface metagenome]
MAQEMGPAHGHYHCRHCVHLVIYECRLANQNGDTNITQSTFALDPGAIAYFMYYWC